MNDLELYISDAMATQNIAFFIPYASKSIEAAGSALSEESGVKLSPGVRVLAASTVLT